MKLIKFKLSLHGVKLINFELNFHVVKLNEFKLSHHVTRVLNFEQNLQVKMLIDAQVKKMCHEAHKIQTKFSSQEISQI